MMVSLFPPQSSRLSWVLQGGSDIQKSGNLSNALSGSYTYAVLNRHLTNCMDLCPLWEASSCTATQEVSSMELNSVHNRPTTGPYFEPNKFHTS